MAQALRHIFFAQRAAQAPEPFKGSSASEVQHAGGVGGGAEGAGVGGGVLGRGLAVPLWGDGVRRLARYGRGSGAKSSRQ